MASTDSTALPSRGRRALFFSVPFAAFFTLLLLVELAVRVVAPPLSTLEVFVQAPEQRSGFGDIYHFAGVFEGDPLLFWRLKPDLQHVVWDFTPVTTNRAGLRYSHEVGRKKKGAFRIACFGDSVTFGYRVPTVWPEQPQAYDHSAYPYPELLEKVLQQLNPGREIEVIPYAVPGYSSHQGLAFARRELPRIEADVVIACYGWNDINLRSFTDRESMDTSARQVLLRRLISPSQALLHASLWYQRGHGAAANVPPERGRVTRVLPDEYVDNLKQILALAARHGGKGVVLAPVYRDPYDVPDESVRISEHRRRLREAFTREKLPYVEIPELTEAGWPDNKFLFGEKIHPSAIGHRRMAQALLQYMVEHEMLADLKVAPAH
jgi:lysophospholipase L1-like esterase